MDIILWVVQILLAFMFLFAGSMKAFLYDKAKEKLSWVKSSSKGFVNFVGFAEVIGAIGLIVPTLTGIAPILTPIAAICLAVTMLAAAFLHVARKEYADIGVNVVLLALTVFVAYGRLFVENM